jgi:outer membrane protein assembly factor BamB
MHRSILLCACLLAGNVSAGEDWPQFRGPTGEGVSDATGLAVKWSEKENIKWKTPIPGEGWSSPVILGGKIWMATALDNGKSLRATGVDRETGKVLHDLELFHVEAPAPKHELNSHASPTPVLEQGRAYFSYGMYGSACVDTDTGKVLWKNTALHHDHDGNGPGSTPVIHDQYYLLNCDGTELRYVVALNKNTGRIAWKTNRSNEINKAPAMKKAYATPLVITVNGRDLLISPGAFRVSAYEVKTGREVWWCDIPGFSNVTRPVFAHGLVYVGTGFGKHQLWAIKPDGQGDIANTHVVWKAIKGAPDKASPIVAGEELYMVSGNGILSCLDAKSGSEIWTERIGGEYSASPVLADGHIYFFSHQGPCTVIKPGRKYEPLATNLLADGFMASPAIAGKAMYLRTKTALYRVEK